MTTRAAVQREAWDAAPFEPFARTSSRVHDALVAALGVRPGERWLDVATGTGAVALRAARAGALVSAIDLAPQMVATARAHAQAGGLRLDLRLGEAERLPYPDGAFDVVASAHGVVFALDQEAAATELGRVCRPGGRLGLSVLAADRANRDLLGVWRSAAAADPLEWGRPARLRELLGEAFSFRLERCEEPLRAACAEELWELHVRHCGPLKLLVASLTDSKRRALHDDVVAFFERHASGSGVEVPRTFLLVLGERRSR